MWHTKTNAMPVVRGVTGTKSESFTQYLSNKQGKHEIKKIQK